MWGWEEGELGRGDQPNEATFRMLCDKLSPPAKATIFEKNIHFSLMPYGLFERIKKNAKFLLRHRTRTQPILEVQEISGLPEKKKNKVLVTS